MLSGGKETLPPAKYDPTPGRTSKKIAKVAITVGAQLAVTGLVVATGPDCTVGGTAHYNVPIVNPYGAVYQKTFGASSEDARFLYVFNASTNDVTVIDFDKLGELVVIPGTSGRVTELMTYE